MTLTDACPVTDSLPTGLGLWFVFTVVMLRPETLGNSPQGLLLSTRNSVRLPWGQQEGFVAINSSFERTGVIFVCVCVGETCVAS